MRIVVCGTHASGKTTLVSQFAARHPDYDMLPDPFELVDAASDDPDADTFFTQLRLSAARLLDREAGDRLIAERGPLDFLAYLDALDRLRRPTRGEGLFRQGVMLTATAMAHVDLLVLLPLTAHSGIELSADEDLELRRAMNDALLDLADDPDLIGAAMVVEITGEASDRLAQLEDAVTRFALPGRPAFPS